MPSVTIDGQRPKKLQRISQACDLCHRRSIRCRPSTENPQKQCQNCCDFAVDCTYNRPSRRRRNPSIAPIAPLNLLPTQQTVSPTSPGVQLENGSDHEIVARHGSDYTGAYGTIREGRQDDTLSVAWRSFAAASLPTINRHLQVYMEFVYPMFPIFHAPKLWEQIRERKHLTNRGFFASIMAACALVAARARDGATGDKYQPDESSEHSSEIFFSAAQDAMPKDLTQATGLGFLRACALLVLTGMQYGQIQTMHQYLGHYHTLSAMQQFHDEERWPLDITVDEREERRRLFWSMYSWDVYTSVVFQTPLKAQETHSNVRYPSEASDDEISAGVSTSTNSDSWMRGWIFTVDMYRVLEHAIRRLRCVKQRADDQISVVRLMFTDAQPDLHVMENVVNLYHQLPARFKDFQAPVSGDRSQDIYGFQAANIQATLQLVRMTLFESHHRHNVQQKCDVAEQVLSTFQNVQPHYLKAISTPLVYHLGGIGQILASVMQGVLTEGSYQRVRTLLGSMADLLEELESGLQPTAGASAGLREHVERIDQYMRAQRQMLSAIPQTNGVVEHMATTDGDAVPNGSLHPPMANSLGMRTPLDEFQLPADLTGDWPWPFDLTNDERASGP